MSDLTHPLRTTREWNWKCIYALVLAVLIILCGVYLASSASPGLSPSARASAIWGGLTLTLGLIFMLGAADSAITFLVFFGTGAFGAGMGYLVGAWLTPNAESNPLDQVRNIAAGVLSGIVGTKLLSLWDDLVDKPQEGGKPPIMTAAYFVPIILFLVGFTVSLSAFYTVRAGDLGNVRITYSPQREVVTIDSKHLGIWPDSLTQFAAAANSSEDITVSWDFRFEKPCWLPSTNTNFDKAKFEKQILSAFDLNTAKLSAPSQTVLEAWNKSCPDSKNLALTAISNQNRAKSLQYLITFCVTKEDCPSKSPDGKAATGPSPTGAPTSTGSVPTPQSGSQTRVPDVNPTTKKEHRDKSTENGKNF